MLVDEISPFLFELSAESGIHRMAQGLASRMFWVLGSLVGVNGEQGGCSDGGLFCCSVSLPFKIFDCLNLLSDSGSSLRLTEILPCRQPVYFEVDPVEEIFDAVFLVSRSSLFPPTIPIDVPETEWLVEGEVFERGENRDWLTVSQR